MNGASQKSQEFNEFLKGELGKKDLSFITILQLELVTNTKKTPKAFPSRQESLAQKHHHPANSNLQFGAMFKDGFPFSPLLSSCLSIIGFIQELLQRNKKYILLGKCCMRLNVQKCIFLVKDVKVVILHKRCNLVMYKK